MFIVDEASGIVIGDGDSSSVGRNLKDFASGSLHAQTAEAVSGHNENRLSLNVDGRVFKANLSWIPNSDWVMVAYAPKDEVMSDANAMTRTLILMAALALEKLSATISNLSEQLRRNANEARAVSDEVNRAAERVAKGNERMRMLIRSMADIKSTPRD